MRSALLTPLLHRLLTAAASSPASSSVYSAAARRTFSNLFVWSDRDAAENYYASRPRYEQRVVPWVLQYYFERHPSSNSAYNKVPLAVDVGCGSGEMTAELAKYCERVIGVDQSPEMIELGRVYCRRPNIEYRVGPAERMNEVLDSTEDGKADLVVGAMVAHFLDMAKFVAEVRRCLRPGGVVGLVGYHSQGYEEAGEEFKDTFEDFLRMQLGHHDFFQSVDEKLQSHYRSLEFPFENVRHMEEDLDLQWTHRQVASFMATGKELFKYPEKKVGFPYSEPQATALCRMHVFGVIGHT